MAPVLTWLRQTASMGTTPGGRATFFGPPFPPGSTLERSIFGFSLWLDGYYAGDLGSPRKLTLVFGLIDLPSSSPAPDFDPVGFPSADWTWAGMITGTIEPLRQIGDREYRLQFNTPASQLETASRRRNTLTESRRIWLVTDPLSSVDSGFTEWDGVSIISALHSLPG